jgi:hypothetical protein
MKEPREEICSFFPQIPWTVPHLIYIAADWCSQRDTVPVMFSVLPHSTFTVQILYKLYSHQLNCTYSNYTQAAAPCSAAQQHTNCPSDLFWSVVLQVVWYCTVTHIQRLNVINKFNCLKTHGRGSASHSSWGGDIQGCQLCVNTVPMYLEQPTVLHIILFLDLNRASCKLLHNFSSQVTLVSGWNLSSYKFLLIILRSSHWSIT